MFLAMVFQGSHLACPSRLLQLWEADQRSLPQNRDCKASCGFEPEGNCPGAAFWWKRLVIVLNPQSLCCEYRGAGGKGLIRLQEHDS